MTESILVLEIDLETGIMKSMDEYNHGSVKSIFALYSGVIMTS